MGFPNRKNGSLALFLLLLLPTGKRTTALGQILFPSDEPCRIPTGEVGNCLPLTDCPPVLQSFRQRPPVTCGFEGFTQLVCCPKDPVQNSSTLLQSMNISLPPGYNRLDCGKETVKRIETFRGHSSSSSLAVRRQERANVPLPVNAFPDGHLKPSVVGGTVSFRAAWPWIALLGQRDPLGIDWFCGGALINEYWVLSAAHCFKDFKADVVRLGEHDYADDNDGALHEDFGVQDMIYYPDYKPPEAYHDLALLKLDSKVQLQDFILPVCLPFGKKSEEKILGTVVTIVGWGNTLNGGFPSSVLREADVQVFPSSRCDRSYSSIPNYAIQWPQGIGEETLCAGDSEGGKDACQGDSGGPLVSQDAEERFVLAGIVSRGYGCGHRDYPGLYANLRHKPYLAWIKKVAFSTQ